MRMLWIFGVAAACLAVLGVLWFFNGDLRSGARAVEPPEANPLPVPILLPDDQVHSQYAGSTSCRECHREEYEKWQDSNHGLAERAYRADMDEEGFEPPQELVHGSVTSKMFLDAEGVATFLTQGLGKGRTQFPVVRVIGNDPLRQFLVPAPGGRLQTMDVSWDPHRKEWFDVFGEDHREPGEWGHWTGRGMNWNAMCAACHNTRLRKHYDVETDAYHTSMAEMTVGCEACHGPMKKHVDWQREAPSVLGWVGQEDPRVQVFDREQHFDTCGACHARRSELSGDLIPGEPFHDHFQLIFTDETPIYYPDGQVQDENYEYASLLSSSMHGAGVRCVDCHDPHTGKRLLEGNSLCMRCHTGATEPPAPIIDPLTHSPCAPDSAGTLCTSCHMPQTTYMARHPRHDHGFTIPDPLLTQEFGVPNACNRCHTDRDAAWAVKQSEQFYGEKMDRPTRHRAIAFAQGRRGDSRAVPSLIALLADPTQQPIWHAGACRLLARWAFDGETQEALLAQLSHRDPLVRAAAVYALTPPVREGNQPIRRAVQALWEDASRSVRVAAAWALNDMVELDSKAGRELTHMLALAADQPTGQMQLGQFAHARGDDAKAIGHMRRAIEIDPHSAPFYHDLAILLNAQGDLDGCVRALQQAIAIAPTEAEYHYTLALALNEQGKLAEATEALQKTVELDPNYARAWYNLGLAWSAAGNLPRALDSLLRAEHLQPNDASIPYARATVLAQLGRLAEAAQAAQRALMIQPNFTEARELLQQLR